MSNEIAIRAGRPLPLQYEVSDIEKMARAISASKLFGITSPEQALALCLIAQAEGRHPASAAQDYHIVQNRPAKKSDAMLRDFLAAGGRVEWHALTDDLADATFSHAAGGTARITWDHDRAKQAGIANPMWKKYPRQMLRSRVVSEGVRTVFPMATSGMYVPEEVQEFASREESPLVEQEPKRIRDGSDGRPKSSRQAKISGDWDIVKEIAALPTEAALDEWLASERIAPVVASYNGTWRDQFDEAVAAKRDELTKPKTLSDADSALLLKSLVGIMGRIESRLALKSWAEDNQVRGSINTLTETDRETLREFYDMRKEALPAT